MRIFGIPEAKFYCQSFSHEPGEAESSIKEFTQNRQHIRLIKEGTPIFNEYRACSLRDVERSLFFSASLYRRSLDLMIPSSSHWAHVTMYYGCWYAARAILGMFGCSIFDKIIIDVKRSHPTQQELSFRRIGRGIGEVSTTYSGSHQRFWDLFYRAVIPLRPIVGPQLSYSLLPISGNVTWQIEHRNDINYDTRIALEAAKDFQSNFSPSIFPNCLKGAIGTQYGLLEGLLKIAFSFAKQFVLKTDGISLLSPSGSRSHIISNLIYFKKSANLVSKTTKLWKDIL